MTRTFSLKLLVIRLKTKISTYKLFAYKLCIYIYNKTLALNNPQGLNMQQNNQNKHEYKYKYTFSYKLPFLLLFFSSNLKGFWNRTFLQTLQQYYYLFYRILDNPFFVNVCLFIMIFSTTLPNIKWYSVVFVRTTFSFLFSPP